MFSDNLDIKKLYEIKEQIENNTYVPQKKGIERTEELMERAKMILNCDNKCISFKGNSEAINYFKNLNRDASYINLQPQIIKKAIEIYTNDGYLALNNDFLRKNKGLIRKTNEKVSLVVDYTTTPLTVKDFYLEGIVDALDTLINQTSISEDMLLYRGCETLNQFNNLGISKKEELFTLIGKSFIEYGYTSTSTTLAEKFIYQCPIKMIIKIPKGTHIANLIDTTLAIDEGEILIERNSEFVINKVEIIDGKYFVYTQMKSNILKKGVDNIEKIKLVDKDEDLTLIKYPDEDYYEEFDEEFDEEFLQFKKR